MLTDEQLAALAAQGNRMALSQLAERYHERLFRFYYKCAGPNMAADMAQAALLRLVERVHRYRAGPQPFSAWLFTLAYRLFIDETRKKRPLPLPYEDIRRIAGGREESAAAVERQEAQRLLRTLKPDLRAMVVLRYYMDQSYEEIATAMGTSAVRVKWRLHDALERMRKEAQA